MTTVTRLLFGITLTLSIVFVWAGVLPATMVTGIVKQTAPEAQLFTLRGDDDKLLLISWSTQTRLHNLKKPADIRPDDYLIIDYGQQDDQLLATAITLPQVTLPPGVAAATLAQIDQIATNPGNGELVIIDVRPTGKFDAGHLPGARSIPLSRIVKRTAGLLPPEKNRPVVFYDDGNGTNEAVTAADLTGKNGYSRVLVLKEGVRGWVDSGRFLASSPAFIRKSKPAVIDLRSIDKVHQGHLEGATNFPLGKLPQMYGNFPLNRRMPLVVYGENDDDARAGAAIIRNWGYKYVTILQGGTAGWLDSAEALESGPAAEFISIAATESHGGQLQPSEFELAVNSPQTVEIVDVRNDADHRKGRLQTGVHIPLHDLARRHKELSRVKIQVVFAASADQAEIAYDFLKSKGYRVNYLAGTVEFDPAGFKVK